MKHGLSKTRLYSIYSGMKQRCYNPNNQHFQQYGGRGISICDEWLGENGLQNFFEWSLNHGYNENLTIDRIESDKGYSPENCQWITASLNSYRVNSDDKDFSTYTGEFLFSGNEQILIEIRKIMLETKITQREIAEKLGIKPQGLTKMLNKKNFGFEDAKKILDTMGYDLIVDFKQHTEEN